MSEVVGKLSRRTLFAGVGTAGAVATVASLLPTTQPAQVGEQQERPAPAKGGGYHLSEHVQRYFKTAQI